VPFAISLDQCKHGMTLTILQIKVNRYVHDGVGSWFDADVDQNWKPLHILRDGSQDFLRLAEDDLENQFLEVTLRGPGHSTPCRSWAPAAQA